MAETGDTKRIRGQVWRFLLLGVGNTVVTGALLAFLARVLDPAAAYTLVFAVGLLGTTVMSGRFVFRTRVTFTRSIAFIAVYLAIYACGRFVIAVVPSFLGPSPDVMAAAVVIVTAPLSFLGGRLVFDRRPRVDAEAPGTRGITRAPPEGFSVPR